MQTQSNPGSSSVTADIGRAIRDARRQRDMTQEALALESGLQRRTVYEIERGKTDPRIGTLHRIATAMKVHVADLLAPSSHERSP